MKSFDAPSCWNHMPSRSNEGHKKSVIMAQYRSRLTHRLSILILKDTWPNEAAWLESTQNSKFLRTLNKTVQPK